MSIVIRYILILVLVGSFVTACEKEESTETRSGYLFEMVDPDVAGIEFQNTLPEETMSSNIYNFNYLYNGAGVAAGDVNNDGLADLYLVGNDVPNKLYLNKGNFQFEDITEKAGVSGGPGWHTGVQMIDINGDSWLDIYVCRGAWNEPAEQRKNLLYINNGNGTFSEQGKTYGIDDSGFSMDAAFFDLDKDGDLDLYVTNRPKDFFLTTDHIADSRNDPPAANRDRLYRNNGDNSFTDITEEAGITPNYGYGLSVTIADLDSDGWDDIYVANDFLESDYLYMNQGDGTFREEVKKRLPHVAFYAMGTDIADFNGDGFEDILNVEMLPEDYKRSKTSMASMKVEEYHYMLEKGMHQQFMHNMLQMNHGNGHFGDVSQIAGVKTTDWSWACFLEDFDNDGMRDIFVANGYKRDVYDQDAIKKAQQLIGNNEMDESFPLQELLEYFPINQQMNYFFRNTGDLSFEKVSTQWAKDRLSLSNGAALADLDNNGTVDLVTNNIDQPVQIYKNLGVDSFHAVRVRLNGPAGNRQGLGARVICRAGDREQVFQMKTSRGYLSSCEAIAHFGLGRTSTVDEIEVQWPDGKTSVVSDPSVDELITISYDEATTREQAESSEKLFADRTRELFNTPFVHKENKYWDYHSQILLPHRYSQNGPALAVGDVNNDGLEDMFVGGAVGQPGALYLQNSKGQFVLLETPAFEKDKNYEDVVATFLDVDNDGDEDLYVGTGGFEYPEDDRNYTDRLYMNNGGGIFEKDESWLPELTTSTGTLAAGDFDGDGNIDLFVGGWIVPDRYPSPPQSYLLKNTGQGFIDVTEEWAPEIRRLGMITASSWKDMDNDGDPDLIVAGEWMPITIFENDGKLIKANNKFALPERTGWWHSLLVDDLDGDGNMDIVAGNIGHNHKFKASDKKPFHIYAADFDDNGSFDPMLAKYANGVKVPVRGRECSSDQMPFIKDKFATYHDYADAEFNDIFDGSDLEGALHYEANHFGSTVFWGTADGFEFEELPVECQISMINGIGTQDVNDDGKKDLILVGNMFQTERETTRSDAGIGKVLLQRENRKWQVLPWSESGLFLPGDVKRTVPLSLGTQRIPAFLAAYNNDTLRIVNRYID